MAQSPLRNMRMFSRWRYGSGRNFVTALILLLAIASIAASIFGRSDFAGLPKLVQETLKSFAGAI